MNALLFGALIVAPASTFVSCSDYDDDIQGLRNDLDAAKQSLEAMINEKISAVEGEIANLQAADEALQKAYEDADEAIRLAYAQADETLREQLLAAINEGDAATLAAAQKLVNDAKTELQAALDECKASCNQQFADQNAKIDALIAADAELSQAITAAQAKADDAYALATEAKTTADEALKLAQENKEELGEIWTLLTGQAGSLTETITGLQSAITTLQNQYSTLSGEVQELTGRVAEAESAISAQEKALEEYKEQMEEKHGQMEADVQKKYEDAMAEVEKVRGELAEQKAELEKLVADEVKKVQDNVDTLSGTVDELKKAHEDFAATVASDIEDLSMLIDETKVALLQLKDQMMDEVNVLSVLLGQELRSLVFKPELYVDGVEATEYGYMPYNVYPTWTGAPAVMNEQNHECSFPDNVLPGGVPVAREYDPVVYLQYHMNPSSAQIDEGALSFVSRDAEFITRANESVAGPQVIDYSVENGMLTVGMKAKGGAVETAGMNDAGGDAAIFALQAKVRRGEQGDTLITSDYAMLYTTQITPEAIAFTTNDHGGVACTGAETTLSNELYTSLDDVMGNPAAFEVKYDSQEGVDLKKYLQVHYAWNTKTKNAVDHGAWAYGEEANFGLSYKFDLVYYSVDGNATSDSKYAKLEDGVLKAYAVDASGNTTNTQDRSSIGREPLVRVTVVDEAGDVVLYGFLKFKVVEETQNKVTDPFVTEGGDVDVCDAQTYNITWAQVSAQILSKVNMSNPQFHNAYGLVTDGSGNAQQFTFKGQGTPADGAEFEALDAADYIGEVKEYKEEEATRTSRFEWTLSDADQQAVYEKAGHTVTIYIAYAPKDASDGSAKIFLPLTVTFNEKAAAGEITATPLDTYWEYGPTGDKAGMNVLQPTNGGNTKLWTVDVHQIWEGSKIEVPAKYAAYADHLRFYFRPSSFNGYQLTVNDTKAYDKFSNTAYDPTAENEQQHALEANRGVYANTKLWCNGQEIASIDPVTGVITMNNNSSVLKEIVNKYPSFPKTAAQAFLNVGMYVFNDCDVVLPLTDDTKWFSEYLLRPINVVGNAGDKAFIDAEDNGSTLNLADVLDFSDWRNQQFKNEGYTNVWYYAFYGIQSVTVDIANITTNMNSASGEFRLLSQVAPDVKVTQRAGDFSTLPNYNNERHGNELTWGAIQRMFGTITYDNNGNPIGEGNVLRLPVKVTYDWGTVTTTVDIPVKSAYQQ